MIERPIDAVIIGGGHRSLAYAGLAERKPDMLRIVGIAEPDDRRRETIAARFGIPADRCYRTAEQLAAVPKFADAAINGTLDDIHVPTSLPLLRTGYDILLEKPFAVNETEMNTLVKTAAEYGRKIMVCFVLRYAPFYYQIKERIVSGGLGDIVSIQTAEHVSYHHMSTSHVRGKWSNTERCHATMLLAKCCHDLDLMMWLMGGDKPCAVSSFGSNFQFNQEKAPEGAGTRCVVDCPLVDTCLYSAKRLYLDHPDRWKMYVWDKLEGLDNPTIEDKKELLKTSPYGVCAYKSDNNVVDHQSVLVNFKSGAVGTHNMVGGAAAAMRRIHIIGTKGELYGRFEDGYFTVSMIDPRPGCEHSDERVDVNTEDSHGGGDGLLIEDFVHYVRGEAPSLACTSIEGAVPGHLVVFKADESREHGGAVMRVKIE